MPIEKIVDSLDSVDEDLRGFYVEKDGKFHLEDVTSLRNTMRHTKDELKTAKAKAAQVTAWEKLGKTPDEIQQLLTAQAAAAEQKAREAGDHEALLRQHQENWNKERGTLASAVDIWRNKYQNTELSYNLTSELVKLEATAEGIELLPNILRDRVQFEVEGDVVKTKILAADKKTTLAGNGADGQATFADLVKEAKTKYPSLFKGSGQSGSGASDTDDKGGAGHGNLKRSQMSVEDKTTFISKNGEDVYLKLPY